MKRFSGEFDPVWLTHSVAISDYLAGHLPLIERATQRGNLEAAQLWQTYLSEIQDQINAEFQIGDELWHWYQRNHATGSSGNMGIAIRRSGVVVHAWTTAFVM
jgi:hypothetical protein